MKRTVKVLAIGLASFVVMISLIDPVFAQNENKNSAIMEWMNQNPVDKYHSGQYDLVLISLTINEVLVSESNLILINFTLENNNDKTIYLKGGVLDLRTFDPIKFESEARTSAPEFNYAYDPLIPERAQTQYANIDFVKKCQRLDLTLEQGSSQDSILCFNPIYEKYPLSSSGFLEYYLVLSNRPVNSCPFCKPILLNDKIIEKIPSWIKNTAGWWCKGTVNDDDFVNGLQYLITEGIIIISPTQSGQGTSQVIPEWIKNNACWWSDGLIDDSEFVTGIQFLIQEGVIQV